MKNPKRMINFGVIFLAWGVLNFALAPSHSYKDAVRDLFPTMTQDGLDTFIRCIQYSGVGLGIIGAALLVAGLMKPAPKSATGDACDVKPAAEMKRCPSCAEYIKIEAQKCRYCGEDLRSHD